MHTLSETFASPNRLLTTTGFALVALLTAWVPVKASTLSDNLSGPSAGTEDALGDTWLSASFTTGSSSYSLSSVTLALANPTSSSVTAQVTLYTDDGLNEPGTELGLLAPTSDYPSTLSALALYGNNLALSAASKYWVVLSTASGELD